MLIQCFLLEPPPLLPCLAARCCTNLQRTRYLANGYIYALQVCRRLLWMAGAFYRCSLCTRTCRCPEYQKWYRERRGECNGKCLEETKTIGRQSFFVTRFSFFFSSSFSLSVCCFFLRFLPSSPHRQQPHGLSHYQRKISIFRLIFCSFHYWNNNRVYYCWVHCRNKQKTNKQTEVYKLRRFRPRDLREMSADCSLNDNWQSRISMVGSIRSWDIFRHIFKLLLCCCAVCVATDTMNSIPN